MKRALVLGGGGQFAIGWETGYLVGLADFGIDTHMADLIVGTSAGAQVGLVVASGTAWNDAWERQANPNRQPEEENPSSDLTSLFAKYDEIAASSNTPEEWIRGQGRLAIESHTLSESEHLSRIGKRISDFVEWPEKLRIVAVDLETSQRVIWGAHSGIDLYKAASASGSLPGVWPPTTIGSRRYIDGGCYSMENADIAKNFDKVLVLSSGLPVSAPFGVEEQVRKLQGAGGNVELVKPDKKTFEALKNLKTSPVDPRIRPVIAACGRNQGNGDAERIAQFWN